MFLIKINKYFKRITKTLKIWRKTLDRQYYFDVDGTLWDSTDVVADAWNQIMEKKLI